MVSKQPVERGARVHAIDATRGVAMLAVFLAHFGESYLRRHGMPMARVYAVSQLASPTFMLISGTLLGYFHVTRRERFGEVARSYLGRGLFLVTLGRVVILLFHIPMSYSPHAVVHWGFITDAIAVCLMIGPAVVARTTARTRVLMAVLLYVISWFAVLSWIPPGPLGHFVEETLFGPHADGAAGWYTDMFPVLPWLGLFLVGSGFGERLAGMEALGGGRAALAARWGCGALLVGAALRMVGWWWGRPGEWLATLWSRGVFSPFAKLPPGPVYVFIYGGVGLLILAVLLAVEGTSVLATARGWLETVGRHSLILFIAQYGVYFALMGLLDLPYTPWWPALFAGTVVALMVFARWWDRRGWSRYLTVPLPGGRAGP